MKRNKNYYKKNFSNYNFDLDKDLINLNNMMRSVDNLFDVETIRTSKTFTEKPILTEDIYTERNFKIKQLKEENKRKNRNVIELDISLNCNKNISLFNNNYLFWDYNSFYVENKEIIGTENEEFPKIVNNNWSKIDDSDGIKNTNIELKNIIYRSQDFIDYYICNCEIESLFTLKGESSFWLFLRCSENIYEENSSIIEISKKSYSQNIYISLGIMYNGKYKVLTKQQLINYNKTYKNKKYIDNDLFLVKLIILEPGNDNLSIKIFLNESNIENNINCNFFLPTVDKKLLFIGGFGDECIIESFNCRNLIKPKYTKQFSDLIKKLNGNNIKNENNCCILF